MRSSLNPLCIGLIGLVYSSMATSLGLGEITVKSLFNQPLEAEIAFVNVQETPSDQIIVSLATADEFQRRQLDRPFFLTDLSFKVVLDNPDKPFIEVTSSKPVIEPYLNFIVEIQLPSGRLLREYTALLDLPEPVKDVQEPTPPSSTVTDAENNRPQQTPVRPSNSAVSVTDEPVNEGSYRIRSGDTLWVIAERTRPDRSVPVKQMMFALQQYNPHAFINNDINLIKSEVVLEIPSISEIRAVDVNRVASTSTQNTQKTENTATSQSITSSPLPTETQSTNTGAPQGRLRLTSESTDLSSDSIEKEELVQALRQSMDTTANLQNRVIELEEQLQEQIKAMEVLLAEANQNLPVTNDLDENNVNTDSSLTPIATTATDVGSEFSERQSTEFAQPDSIDEISSSGSDTTEPTAEENPVQSITGNDTQDDRLLTIPSSEPIIAPSTNETTTVDNTEDQTINLTTLREKIVNFDYLNTAKNNAGTLIIAALVLLLTLLFIFTYRNKRKTSDQLIQFQNNKRKNAAGNHKTAPRFQSKPSKHSTDTKAAYEKQQNSKLEPEYYEVVIDDQIAEADICFSLGQIDKAIDILRNLIDKNPNHSEAHLALLKVYAQTNLVDELDEHFEKIHALKDKNLLRQASALRQYIEKNLQSDDELDPMMSTELELPEIEGQASNTIVDTQAEPEKNTSLEVHLELDEDSNEEIPASTIEKLDVPDLNIIELDKDLTDLSDPPKKT